jgi:hypothetical protein
MKNIKQEGQKGMVIRKMRKTAIILYIVIAVFVFTIVILRAVNRGEITDLSKSPFLYLSVWFFVNIIGDKKSKLDERVSWFKNKWGWFDFSIILSLAIGLLCGLFGAFFVMFMK